MIETWKPILDYGVPLALLVAVVVGVWRGVWCLFDWAKPHLEAMMTEQIQAWRKVADSVEQTHLYESAQTESLKTISEGVQSVDERTANPDSITSNVQTHLKLERLLANDSQLAQAARVALEALVEHHPDLGPRLQTTIQILREVEA